MTPAFSLAELAGAARAAARLHGMRQQAEAFTRQLLSTQRFTVCTKWHAVYGSGRYYAFVIFPDGEDLSAKLVKAGLARIHTGGTKLPDGREAATYEAQLRNLEAQAKAGRAGAWGMR